MGLVHGGIEDPRIGHIHCQIDGPGPLTLMQNQFPVLTTILRAIDAPLWVIAKGVAKCSHINQIWILRMDPNFSNMFGLIQP